MPAGNLSGLPLLLINFTLSSHISFRTDPSHAIRCWGRLPWPAYILATLDSCIHIRYSVLLPPSPLSILWHSPFSSPFPLVFCFCYWGLPPLLFLVPCSLASPCFPNSAIWALLPGTPPPFLYYNYNCLWAKYANHYIMHGVYTSAYTYIYIDMSKYVHIREPPHRFLHKPLLTLLKCLCGGM